MNITSGNFIAFVQYLEANAQAEEHNLNAADAKLGDGDTGSMLRRVFSAMARGIAGKEQETLSETAKAAAAAAMKETGSSLGSLVATALITFAKMAKAAETDGQPVTVKELPALLGAIRDAVANRGKSAIGDKTVVDSLDCLATRIKADDVTLASARSAADEALANFRDKPCKIGRARMFPEKSIGLDDPGMLACRRLLGDAD